MSSDAPYLDTKPQVELVYEGKPTYCCAQCDAVIVRPLANLYIIMLKIRYQTLQDETISKAFSGRDGRGLCVFTCGRP